MMQIIFCVTENNIQKTMDAADLSNNGTKAYVTIMEAKSEKEVDIKTMLKTNGKYEVVACYCNGKIIVKEGIKTLSNGKGFMTIEDFKEQCDVLFFGGKDVTNV